MPPIFRGDYAAEQNVIDTSIVFREQNAQPFANLQSQRLRLEFLRMTLGHGELSLDGEDLGRPRRADKVPERGLARRGGDTHP